MEAQVVIAIAVTVMSLFATVALIIKRNQNHRPHQ